MLALVLDGGQLRLHLVSRGSDVISRVGNNLDNGDWFQVKVTLATGRYTVEGKSRQFLQRCAAAAAADDLICVYVVLCGST